MPKDNTVSKPQIVGFYWETMAETMHPFGDPQAVDEIVFTNKQGSQPDNTRGTECLVFSPKLHSRA